MMMGSRPGPALATLCHAYSQRPSGCWPAGAGGGQCGGRNCPPCAPRRMPVSTKPVEDDIDVASERQRVLRGDADNDMVKIENLTKVGAGLE